MVSRSVRLGFISARSRKIPLLCDYSSVLYPLNLPLISPAHVANLNRSASCGSSTPPNSSSWSIHYSTIQSCGEVTWWHWGMFQSMFRSISFLPLHVIFFVDQYYLIGRTDNLR